MNVLDLPTTILGLPERAWVWLGGLLACLLVWAALAVAWHHHNEAMRDEGRAEVTAQWKQAVDREQANQDAIEADRRVHQQENDLAHAQALDRARADAASAHAAADSLQHRVAALLAARNQAGQGDPAGGHGPGQQGADAADLLADVQRRLDDASGQLAGYADALRIAGERCEAYADREVTP